MFSTTPTHRPTQKEHHTVFSYNFPKKEGIINAFFHSLLFFIAFDEGVEYGV